MDLKKELRKCDLIGFVMIVFWFNDYKILIAVTNECLWIVILLLRFELNSLCF